MEEASLEDEGTTKLTARVAPYLEAISEARRLGWSWADIAKRVAPQALPVSVKSAVRLCRYKAEQRPLPILPASRSKVEAMVTKKPDDQSPPRAAASQEERKPRKLPRLGESRQADDDDGLTQAQRLISRIPKI